jgi:hypothetical protein
MNFQFIKQLILILQKKKNVDGQTNEVANKRKKK